MSSGDGSDSGCIVGPVADLEARLRLVIFDLQFFDHDLIFVPMKPAATQITISDSYKILPVAPEQRRPS